MVQLMQKVPVPKRRRREMQRQGVEMFFKNGKINIEKKKHFFEKETNLEIPKMQSQDYNRQTHSSINFCLFGGSL